MTLTADAVVAIVDVLATVVRLERALVKVLAELDGHLVADKLATFGCGLDVFFGREFLLLGDAFGISFVVNTTINLEDELVLELQKRELDLVQNFGFGQDSVEISILTRFLDGFLDCFLGSLLALRVPISRLVWDRVAFGSKHRMNPIVHMIIKWAWVGSGTEHIRLFVRVDTVTAAGGAVRTMMVIVALAVKRLGLVLRAIAIDGIRHGDICGYGACCAWQQKQHHAGRLRTSTGDELP
jgi:hypothetical protein